MKLKHYSPINEDLINDLDEIEIIGDEDLQIIGEFDLDENTDSPILSSEDKKEDNFQGIF